MSKNTKKNRPKGPVVDAEIVTPTASAEPVDPPRINFRLSAVPTFDDTELQALVPREYEKALAVLSSVDPQSATLAVTFMTLNAVHAHLTAILQRYDPVEPS